MKAGNQTKTHKSAKKLNVRAILMWKIFVAAVAGGLLVAPLTRAHKH